MTTFNGDQAVMLDRVPIRLPGSLATLLTELADQAPSGWAANSPSRWLLPGTRPGQHLSDTVLARTPPSPNLPKTSLQLSWHHS
ncbi:hypothetical protein [Streptomyces sp. NPDC039028]|uniref:hypothetical protein n=1 Tax=unclassified Streptomyces TaxID=2593676 RepID=UPI0033F4F5C0